MDRQLRESRERLNCFKSAAKWARDNAVNVEPAQVRGQGDRLLATQRG
jgi:hypothetical protein